ncbi:MAG: MBL fold metallo-hydrolase [Desulfobacteraceae bacterium]|nr:MBL fold metallo-hydrolase [Desulfobacteraceae bacterium]MBC2754450.1 MBL fold metallo-hydrolase [Desulfobacteraceae bacterium]
MQICMLASGSRGNSIYISNGDTSVLIDAGLSGIEIERRMKSRNLNVKNIDAIIVSHEHSDHIQGVGILARRYNLPVYISSETFNTAAKQLGSIKHINNFSCGTEFAIKHLNIRPFSISHDASDPAGFTIGCNGQKIGIATDLGIATAMVRQHLKNCCCLILEANHDVPMLEDGPYPWPVKQRVKGRSGHLSNESSRELLMDVMHDQMSHVILAHLSETNNTPEKALRVVTEHLPDTQLNVSVAAQSYAGPIIHL